MTMNVSMSEFFATLLENLVMMFFGFVGVAIVALPMALAAWYGETKDKMGIAVTFTLGYIVLLLLIAMTIVEVTP